MSLLQTLGAGQGFLKAGFLGFPKSGKTWTATLLAIGTRKALGLKGPIAMFDTEGGSEYIASLVKAETGSDLVGLRSRSLDDLIAMGRECESSGVAALLVDSATHVWREICGGYLLQVNERLERLNRPKKRKLEFQDWEPIKSKWAAWTDFYLNSKLHIVICGRAGYEYDFEEREDGTGKDLIKTGVKMKTEGEFGFEPSLLIEMERVQVRQDKKLTKEFVHRATIIGDRFNQIDGATCDDPAFEFFKPHVERLTPGAHAPINTTTRSDFNIGDDGDEFSRERKLRVIICEKIQAALVERWPGQSAAEKKTKVEALKAAFGTASWTEVETRMPAADLKKGLALLESTYPIQAATAAQPEAKE